MEVSYFDIGSVPSKLYRAEVPRGTVVAVHGFGGSKESGAIERLAQFVCDKGLNVLTFDLPAHGERTETAAELSVEKCIEDLLAAERYAKELGGELYAFATSFGGMCMLHRLERFSDGYRKVVLRVPAVDMSESLLRVAGMCDKEFSLDKAKSEGFKITLGREYVIPYHFYEELQRLNCTRSSEVWNSDRFLTVYVENDELVSRDATEEFLRCNPRMRSLCVMGSGHRMSQPRHLEQALTAAAEFMLSDM